MLVGLPGAVLTYHRMSQCSQILSHRWPGTQPCHLLMKPGVSRAQQDPDQPVLSRYPGLLRACCCRVTQTGAMCQSVFSDASEDILYLVNAIVSAKMLFGGTQTLTDTKFTQAYCSGHTATILHFL